MEITDIIKESFIFPSQNLEKFVIYVLLTFVMGLLAVGGVISGVFAAYDNVAYFAITAILAIIAIAISLVMSGYQVNVLKSGIDQVEDAPEFDWKNDLVKGILLLVVSIVYFIIPAIIVMIVALITNLPGHFINVAQYAALSPVSTSSPNVFSTIPESALAGLGISISITVVVGLVLFIIFAFLYTMGEARLANTGSLGEALNIPEAFRDITRIGIGKVIAVVFLIVVIVAVIEGILGFIYGRIPSLSILSIIVTPYLTFATQRATGLLYSDIA